MSWREGTAAHIVSVIELTEAGDIDVDYTHSEGGFTALMLGSALGHQGVVDSLLAFGANPSLKSPNGWNSLDWALKYNNEDIAEILVAHTSPNDSETNLVSTENKNTISNVLYSNLNGVQIAPATDINLITNLLVHIHHRKEFGAILVFLPGYSDIVRLREHFNNNPGLFDDDPFRVIVYTVHSRMQVHGQDRILRSSPVGQRKIILATNIAETSITIDDVVFVIDTGKVVDRQYDVTSGNSFLNDRWIFQSNAANRKICAGRISPGYCYRLYTRSDFQTMCAIPSSELCRLPLEDVVLHARLLTNTTISDFFVKAIEPVYPIHIQSAVDRMILLDAFDHGEQLTELGQHLCDLPIEPKHGKMVLISAALKCLDPVLTITCVLACKEPFSNNSDCQSRTELAIRRKFAANSFSDHMALLRAFQYWQKAKNEGWEKSFCDKNMISSAHFEIILGLRTQLLGQLRASGFVKARGGGDIRDLNANSENWAVVKAALAAGMYPSLLRVDRDNNRLFSAQNSRVRFHTKSVLFADSLTTHQTTVSNLPCDWLIYDDSSKPNLVNHIRRCTLLSSITVALFTSQSRLVPEYIDETESAILECKRNSAVMEEKMVVMDDVASDSESEDPTLESRKVPLRLDDFVRFRLDEDTAYLVMHLRMKLHAMLLRRMKNPVKQVSAQDEATLRTVIMVLTSEEQTIGLRQPSGVGARPRPMSAELFCQDITVDNIQTFHTLADDDAFTTDTCDTNRFSCYSPPLSDRLHISITNHRRYFLIRCVDRCQLEYVQTKNIYCPQNSPLEIKLATAFHDQKQVILFFTLDNDTHFHGFAMVKEIVYAERSTAKEFPLPSFAMTFVIDWLKRTPVSGSFAYSLLNPWSRNSRISQHQSGQEIEPTIGDTLVHLLKQMSSLRNTAASSVVQPPQGTMLTTSAATSSWSAAPLRPLAQPQIWVPRMPYSPAAPFYMPQPSFGYFAPAAPTPAGGIFFSPAGSLQVSHGIIPPQTHLPSTNAASVATAVSEIPKSKEL